MGLRGPIPGENRLRKLQGVTRKDRLPEALPLPPGEPVRPSKMTAEARCQWDVIMDALRNAGTLLPGLRALVVMACDSWVSHLSLAKAE
jgi:hypothetical protein